MYECVNIIYRVNAWSTLFMVAAPALAQMALATMMEITNLLTPRFSVIPDILLL